MDLTPAEQYRREAEHVRELASLAASEVLRQQLLDIAQQYENLADIAEREALAADSG